jgi:hypothetical protein
MKKRTGLYVSLFATVVGGFWLFHHFSSQQLRWQEIEWQQGQTQPELPTAFRTFETHKLGAKIIQWARQEVAGLEIPGSYAKTIRQDGAVTNLRAHLLLRDQLPSEGEIQKSVAKFKSGSPPQISGDCIGSKEAYPILVRHLAKWTVQLRQECEHKGETLALDFDHSGTLQNTTVLNATFAFKDSPIVLYPKGPALSQLRAMNIQVSSTPFFLFTPALNVVSDAQLTFPDLHEVSQVLPTDPRFDMAQAYYYSSTALSWVETNLKLHVAGLKLRTHVGYPEKTNTAFYYGREVRIGEGDNTLFSHIAWDPTIVIHETMHSVVEDMTHMPFSGEGGSLSEAMADSLTALQLQTPKMGEASYKNGPFQRSLETVVALGEKTGKVYHDSLIVSGTVWQIKTELGDATALDLTQYLLEKFTPGSNLEDAHRQIQNWFKLCSEGERCDRIGSILSHRGLL